ncbi:hypothetical protein GCM10009799_20710 [Nocardiopsis rhodophaea]|uniref:Uncharacterized protein n=1 Tax=Nocardiopsis rhodophaea TaxID=280238 RepID=A0ABN2SXX1_9ACTN
MSRVETKVTASSASAAAVTVIIYVTGLVGVEVSGEVAAAAVTLIAAAAGYLAPHTPRPDHD